MRYWSIIMLFFVYSNAIAQGNEKDLLVAAEQFTKALVSKDSAALKRLTADNLVYGHSNGWQQDRKELVADLFNGKISYAKVEESDRQVVKDGNTACVRATMNVEVTMETKPLTFKLHALQVWVWKNKKWQLLSRQSTKIN